MPSSKTTVTPADEAAAEFEARSDVDLAAEAARVFGDELLTDDEKEHGDPGAPIATPAPRRRRGPAEAPAAPQPEPPPVLGLHQKLAQVMKFVERIPKNGVAPAAMGGYAFVQVGDAAAAIRRELAWNDVTMMPVEVQLIRATEHETGRGGVMTTETYHVTWEFVDGVSGERHRIQSVGTGADRGDKASPKAQTNAMKYALLMAFLMPTGDDPELEDSSDRHQKGAAAPSQPVIEPGDNVGPVQQGGRQQNATQAQILEIGRFARRLKLGPSGLAAIIDQVLPAHKVPDFPEGTDAAAKTTFIANHLRSLSHEDLAQVIQILMNSTTPDQDDPE